MLLSWEMLVFLLFESFPVPNNLREVELKSRPASVDEARQLFKRANLVGIILASSSTYVAVVISDNKLLLIFS